MTHHYLLYTLSSRSKSQIKIDELTYGQISAPTKSKFNLIEVLIFIERNKAVHSILGSDEMNKLPHKYAERAIAWKKPKRNTNEMKSTHFYVIAYVYNIVWK